jgi:hypothetical protein
MTCVTPQDEMGDERRHQQTQDGRLGHSGVAHALNAWPIADGDEFTS